MMLSINYYVKNKKKIKFWGVMALFFIMLSLLANYIFEDETYDFTLKIMAYVVSCFVLYVTFLNYKETNFNNRFNQLLEQHNKLHNKLEEYIKSHSDEYKLIVNSNINYQTSARFLYKKKEYSPYLRLLYHILKFVDNELNEFKLSNGGKKYTSIVRSLITNDIMLLVAINSLNKDFTYYRELLDKFDFFEHLSIDDLDKRNNYEDAFHIIFFHNDLDYFIKKIVNELFDLSVENKVNTESLNFHFIQIKSHWTMGIDLSKELNSYYNGNNFINFEKGFKNYINQIIDIEIEKKLNHEINNFFLYFNFIIKDDNKLSNKYDRSFICLTKYRLMNIYKGLKCKDVDSFYKSICNELQQYIKNKEVFPIGCVFNINDAISFVKQKNYIDSNDSYPDLFTLLYFNLKEDVISEYLKENNIDNYMKILKDKISEGISDTYLYSQEYKGRKFNMSE